MTLVVTGSIGIDDISTPAGEHREGVLGGSCAYFSAAASFYGPVRMVAAVGDDFSEEYKAKLVAFPNIDVRGLEVREGSKTFRWGGKYLENMDERETLFTDLNVLGEKLPPIPQEYQDSDIVFLANAAPSAQIEMLSHLPKKRFVVADTMNLWIETAKEELLRLLTMIDGLVLNYDEAEQFTGKRNPVAAAKHILKFGPRFVVVKKGEHGAILVHKEGIAALPAYPAENVVDPTGAGDSFAGGMMGYLASQEGEPCSFNAVLKSLAHGTVLASFTIEDFSLERLSRLSWKELEVRYHTYQHMLRIE